MSQTMYALEVSPPSAPAVPPPDYEAERRQLAAARRERMAADSEQLDRLRREAAEATAAKEEWESPLERWKRATNDLEVFRAHADGANHGELAELRRLAPASLREAFRRIEHRRDSAAAGARTKLEALLEHDGDLQPEIACILGELVESDKQRELSAATAIAGATGQPGLPGNRRLVELPNA